MFVFNNEYVMQAIKAIKDIYLFILLFAGSNKY